MLCVPWIITFSSFIKENILYYTFYVLYLCLPLHLCFQFCCLCLLGSFFSLGTPVMFQLHSLCMTVIFFLIAWMHFSLCVLFIVITSSLYFMPLICFSGMSVLFQAASNLSAKSALVVFWPQFISLTLQSLFLKKFILFIYVWLHWVFVTASRFSVVAESGGYSSLWCTGLSLWWLLLLRSTGSRCVGFSSCGSQA